MKGILNWFTLIGAALLIAAILVYRSGAAFRSSAETATATIANFNCHTDSEGDETCCPVLHYTTESGESVTHFSNYCSSSYDLGQQLEIYYDPQNPDEVQIKGLFSQYFAVGMLAFFGLPMFALGLWSGWSASSSKQA